MGIFDGLFGGGDNLPTPEQQRATFYRNAFSLPAKDRTYKNLLLLAEDSGAFDDPVIGVNEFIQNNQKSIKFQDEIMEREEVEKTLEMFNGPPAMPFASSRPSFAPPEPSFGPPAPSTSPSFPPSMASMVNVPPSALSYAGINQPPISKTLPPDFTGTPFEGADPITLQQARMMASKGLPFLQPSLTDNELYDLAVNKKDPHARAILDEKAKQAGLVTEERTRAYLKENLEYADALSEARRKGTLIADTQYLPLVVAARIQAELNVRTTPENIDKAVRLIGTQTRARELNQTLDVDTQKALSILYNTKATLNELNKKFSREERSQYVGVLQQPINKITQFATANPRFADFQALLGRLKRGAFEDGGKQLTPFEFSIVAQYVPQGNELSDADFEAKIATAIPMTQFMIDVRSKLAATTRTDLGQDIELPDLGSTGITKEQTGDKMAPPPRVFGPPTSAPPQGEAIPFDQYLNEQEEKLKQRKPKKGKK